jgi:16S rRNA (uracil1498-N3)-methyltransferase
MNRILFWSRELDRDDCVIVSDDRAGHMRRVLHVKIGDRLRVGVINGAVGVAEVVDVTESGVALRCHCHESQPAPWLDLVLALPRPKVLKRLLAPLASLGVRRLFLTNADKVERNYFDTHVLEPPFIEARCLEGLTQAGTTQLPEVRVIRRLRPFLEDELPGIGEGADRLLLHPRGGRDIPDLVTGTDRGMVLALGPEGGWSSYELGLFEGCCDFQRARLGWRVLRSDVACLAVIGAVVAQRREENQSEDEI